jgi:hypothetical protein
VHSRKLGSILSVSISCANRHLFELRYIKVNTEEY